jgi:hypothetical protein
MNQQCLIPSTTRRSGISPQETRAMPAFPEMTVAEPFEIPGHGMRTNPRSPFDLRSLYSAAATAPRCQCSPECLLWVKLGPSAMSARCSPSKRTFQFGSSAPIAEIQPRKSLNRPRHTTNGLAQPGFIPLDLITAMADGLIRYATSALAASGSLLLAATPTA